MKKVIILTLLLFTTSICRGQNQDGGGGFSFSYSTNNAWGVDMLVRTGNNRFHLGYGHQFNGQKNEVIKNPKKTYELTEIEDGAYFWVIDLGYSRIFMDRITVHSELSIGAKNEFTNFEDDRFSDHGYSLITNTKSVAGIGLNIGYLIKSSIEPFIGIHTLKKVNFGIRISW